MIRKPVAYMSRSFSYQLSDEHCRSMKSNVFRHHRVLLILIWTYVLWGSNRANFLFGDESQSMFFESKIRPVLHLHCLECHNVNKKSGGLALDSREGWQLGGDSGPAVVPREPNNSLLLKTIRHEEPGLEMPSKSPKLDDGAIEAFRLWIQEGAFDPRDQPESLVAVTDQWSSVFAERLKWWCWQPLKISDLPAILEQGDSGVIDFYIDRKLESSGIKASPKAEWTTLARRLSFQLRGLPPSYEDVQGLQAGELEAEWKQLVDRYLDSTEFAEHWTRHWLDTVRYAETHGSEDDAYLPFAYRYRDYMVRAFKQDVPVDRIILENLAGDLIEPRWSSEGLNEALIGLGFYRFVEFNQTPVDVKREEIAVVDAQIDAIGKAFQAITISCARCHDHKFDPVSDEDYYSLYGILRSTRTAMRYLESEEEFSLHNNKLLELQSKYSQRLAKKWDVEVVDIDVGLKKGVEWLKENASPGHKWEDIEKGLPDDRWVKALTRLYFGQGGDDLKEVIQMLSLVEPNDFQSAWQKKRDQNEAGEVPKEAGRVLFDLTRDGIDGWRVYGAGIPNEVARPGAWSILTGDEQSPFSAFLEMGYHSNTVSDRQGGVLRSPDFTIDSEAVSILCRGTGNARARLVIENFQGDSLLFDTVNPTLRSDEYRWVTMDIRPQWRGLRGYLEFLTADAKPYVGIVKDPTVLEGGAGRSSFGVAKVIAHRRGTRLPSRQALKDLLSDESIRSRDELQNFLKAKLLTCLENFSKNTLQESDVFWLNSWMLAGLLSRDAASDSELADIIREYREVGKQIKRPTWTPGVIEDSLPLQQVLLVRGDHRQSGTPMPRKYLDALGSREDFYPPDESGRLQMALEIASAKNPLTARVYVNRVWNWLFGEGLVRTVDNFGRMGEAPTSPELLDYLTAAFIEHGWSTKWLIREIVMSDCWQRSTVPTAAAVENDADNRFWSHTKVRRLEAESIRDQMLWVAGNMRRPDRGVGTRNHYVTVMEPNKQSPPGPVDGEGRRSLYLEVRRNFPNDFLISFDFPRPTSSVGERSTTSVPTQSLVLMNDPFVWSQAKVWADRICVRTADLRERVVLMYRELFARDPDAKEISESLVLIDEVTKVKSSELAWQALAHTLFNLKEAIYLR